MVNTQCRQQKLLALVMILFSLASGFGIASAGKFQDNTEEVYSKSVTLVTSLQPRNLRVDQTYQGCVNPEESIAGCNATNIFYVNLEDLINVSIVIFRNILCHYFFTNNYS